jgi:PAS domain S-box-containing protein
MSALRLVAAALQRLVDRMDPQEGRYRMLFEHSPLPMWVVDIQTQRFLAVNEAAIRLYGYEREAFAAMTFSQLGVPEAAERFGDFVRRASGAVTRGAFRHVTRGGASLDIDAIGHLVVWRGRAARLVVLNDITEQKRTQKELEVSEERLRALSRRLLEVQEAERARLARDLHDDVGQSLTALAIQLGSLARAAGPVSNRVLECLDTARHALERVRQLSLSLRPLQLDDLGLTAALRSHLDRQASIGALTPHFDAADAPHEVAADVETACFRVAQEAITNVLRHARARNLWLRLFTAGGELALSVRDDGQGFDLEAARRRGAAGASLGLVGMEERVALAGGRLELRSAPGQGTVLLATFALHSGERELEA